MSSLIPDEAYLYWPSGDKVFIGSGKSLVRFIFYETTFTDFENLTGNANTDDFIFSNTMVVDGNIVGGGNTDTIDLSAYTTGITANITGANSGTITNVGGNFSSIESLVTGSGNDNFIFSDTMTLSGSITGNAGFEGFEFFLNFS